MEAEVNSEMAYLDKTDGQTNRWETSREGLLCDWDQYTVTNGKHLTIFARQKIKETLL